MIQGDKFIKVVLSIDDPDYPGSQGIKRIEVITSSQILRIRIILIGIVYYTLYNNYFSLSLDQVGFLSRTMMQIHQEHWSHIL